MWSLPSWLVHIEHFVLQGNFALWVILLIALVIFTLFFERLFFCLWRFPKVLAGWQQNWQHHQHASNWHIARIREGLIAQGTLTLNRSRWLLKTSIMACPLLGLMGTVSGMILVFDGLAFSGTGNPRLMASGIFQATIPTMAGMLVAIIGLVMQSILEKISQQVRIKLNDTFSLPTVPNSSGGAR